MQNILVVIIVYCQGREPFKTVRLRQTNRFLIMMEAATMGMKGVGKHECIKSRKFNEVLRLSGE